MDAFINGLITMSMRGVIIIFIVLAVRFLLKKLRISHKYIMGLWAMAFFFFVFPWKLGLPFGFWNRSVLPEEVRMIGNTWNANDRQEDQALAGMKDPYALDGKTSDGMTGFPEEDLIKAGTTVPAGQGTLGIQKGKRGSLGIKHGMGFVWLAGLSVFFVHFLYSYFVLKRKLRLSVLYRENIWWAEEIDIPMVFGMIHPQIYLPLAMQSEDLTCVIAHEKMHIRRKDALFKMLAYVICTIHWFNPFIWIVYVVFSGDMEKACDEEVIRSMSEGQRKEYAYTLLHMAAENGTDRKKIFVAPICFDEGNVKSRIQNVMKYKHTLRGFGLAAVVLTVGLSTVFLTEASGNGQDRLPQTAEQDGQGESGTSTEQVDHWTEKGAGGSFPKDFVLTDERQIEEQSFQVELAGIGEVIFASYEPKWEEKSNMDVVFALLNPGGTVRQILYGTCEDNRRAAGERFDSVTAVEFRDCNGDGYEDVITIAAYSYVQGPDAGKGFSEIRVYHNNGKELVFQQEVSAEATAQLAEPTVDDVLAFLNADDDGQPYGMPVDFDRNSLPSHFAAAIEKYCRSGTLPDGKVVEIPGTISYAVCDVDGDGMDELILQNAHTYMAGMAEWIYTYENGVFQEKFSENPSLTYYDNGVIYAEWQYNRGMAGDSLWPYTLYQYRSESDSYETLGYVDAWNRERAERDEVLGAFPEGIDADGDGCVYFIAPPDWEWEYDRARIVDGPELEKWMDQILGGAEALDIPYQELHVEMVYPAAVG